MNYKTQLLKEHTRANTDSIAKAIGNNKVEFKKIIGIIYNEEAPLPQRAAWVLAAINKNNPELIKEYVPLFIETINQFKIDAVKRNMLLVIASEFKIEERLRAPLLDICYGYILSPTETVVVKVHAMQIIANLTKEHPELKGELIIVIKDQLPKNSAAFKARAKRILKKL